jgi:uncharacterized protein (TIGR02145 family)
MKTTLRLQLIRNCLLLVLVINGISSCNDDDAPKTLPTVVTSTDITEITTSSAKGGGNITSNGNASITATGLVYSVLVTEPTTSDDKTVETATSGSFTSVMANLTSGKTYHVRAYATNEVGTAYGQVLTFMTGNAAPTATDVSVTGTALVGNVLTASYKYDDAENDPQGATTFQWYVADAASGTNEAKIADATNSTFTIQAAQFGKYIRVGVTPRASTGTVDGVEVKSPFKGGETTVTFTYNGNQVTYGIILSNTGKQWLDRNLGAPNAPTSVDDYANYGDLFQWGRAADGHQLTTRTGIADENVSGSETTATTAPYEFASSPTPGHSKFIVGGPDYPGDWLSSGNPNLWQGVSGLNNPCPTGWRIPTKDEWLAENLGTSTEAFAKLKITPTGIRAGDTGEFFQTGTNGRYWTTTIDPSDAPRIVRISVTSSGTTSSITFRGNGYPCRCVKD